MESIVTFSKCTFEVTKLELTSALGDVLLKVLSVGKLLSVRLVDCFCRHVPVDGRRVVSGHRQRPSPAPLHVRQRPAPSRAPLSQGCRLQAAGCSWSPLQPAGPRQEPALCSLYAEPLTPGFSSASLPLPHHHRGSPEAGVGRRSLVGRVFGRGWRQLEAAGGNGLATVPPAAPASGRCSELGLDSCAVLCFRALW